MLPMVNFGFDQCRDQLLIRIRHSGERALEQLNYSLIKNRAWYVRKYKFLVCFDIFALSQPDHVVSA